MWVRAQDGSLVNLDQALAVMVVPARGEPWANGGGPLELRAFGALGTNAVLARGSQAELERLLEQIDAELGARFGVWRDLGPPLEHPDGGRRAD